MKTVLFYLSFIIIYTNSFAQNDITIQWQKCYGGSFVEIGRSVEQTIDGGYVIAGFTDSNDSNVSGNHGYGDYWVVKTDQSGMIQWQKCYGGSSYDDAFCIKQTIDGGYIIAGITQSYDGEVTGIHGQQDIWIVKIDPSGIIQWQKCYGGSSYEYVHEIQQTTDGGYIFAGDAASNDGDVTGNHGNYDYWVVKIDQTGAIQWEKCFGGSGGEAAWGIQQTLDGGFIAVGGTESNNGDVTFNHGGLDLWVVKTDPSGVIQWQKSYGGSGDDVAWGGSQQTTDGGYIISGSTTSIDGDITDNHGGNDYWVVKTDQSGVILWQKTYGGSGEDMAYDIQQTNNEGYIICGSSKSNDGDVTGNHGMHDYWVVKTDPFGTIQWQRSCGGSDDDVAYSIRQTINGSYMVVGWTGSLSGDVTDNHGYRDYWLVMLCNNDPLSISISDTAYCYTTMLSASAGFASYLWNTGDTTQTIVVDTGGIYSVRAVNPSGCPSERVITVPDPIQPYNGEQICMVTLDSLSGKNIIVIEKTLNVGTDSIHIYRMDNVSSLYKRIGSLGINESGIFTDNEAIPAQQSYQYKISVKDTCGRESGLSTMHRTILLQANTGINHEVNLFWNPYEGFEYSTFEIYRSNTRGEFLLIANVPNTTYAFTDLTPPSGTNLYQVRVSKESPCVPTKSIYSHVSSNVITSSNIGIGENQEISFTVHPNPANDNLTITVKAQLVGSIYTITDQTGRILLTGKLTSEVTGINISELSPGMYLFKLGDQNKRIVKIMKN
jgi:hypothetical protein